MEADKTKALLFEHITDTMCLCQLARKEGGHIDQTFELARSLDLRSPIVVPQHVKLGNGRILMQRNVRVRISPGPCQS
uniref:Uncharacterized protein n=1 Tax=Siphoviridae sp. ctNs77 TaxID=2825473 RepID=A0A8S5QHL3_9CAUD|nr:MAG TPA: hypothetical protein [Siphoviridae sp. ctNs77]